MLFSQNFHQYLPPGPILYVYAAMPPIEWLPCKTR
jgi:hypothetical protein